MKGSKVICSLLLFITTSIYVHAEPRYRLFSISEGDLLENQLGSQLGAVSGRMIGRRYTHRGDGGARESISERDVSSESFGVICKDTQVDVVPNVMRDQSRFHRRFQTTLPPESMESQVSAPECITVMRNLTPEAIENRCRTFDDPRVQTIACTNYDGAFFAGQGIVSFQFAVRHAIGPPGTTVYSIELLFRRLKDLAGHRTQTGYVDSPTGANARFNNPTSLAIRTDTQGLYTDSDGSYLLVADTGNGDLRKVQFPKGGWAEGGGAVSTVGGRHRPFSGDVDSPTFTPVGVEVGQFTLPSGQTLQDLIMVSNRTGGRLGLVQQREAEPPTYYPVGSGVNPAHGLIAGWPISGPTEYAILSTRTDTDNTVEELIYRNGQLIEPVGRVLTATGITSAYVRHRNNWGYLTIQGEYVGRNECYEVPLEPIIAEGGRVRPAPGYHVVGTQLLYQSHEPERCTSVLDQLADTVVVFTSNRPGYTGRVDFIGDPDGGLECGIECVP